MRAPFLRHSVYALQHRPAVASKKSNAINFKNSRHAGRLFETARLRQTKSSFVENCDENINKQAKRTSFLGLQRPRKDLPVHLHSQSNLLL